MLFIKIQPDDTTIKYLEETNERLKEQNIVENPFTGYIKPIFQLYDHTIFAVKMTPIYPPFWWGGFITLPFLVLWKNSLWSWWYLPSTIMLVAGVLWTDWFILLGLTKGLRKKAKYRGKIEPIKSNMILELLIDEKF